SLDRQGHDHIVQVIPLDHAALARYSCSTASSPAVKPLKPPRTDTDPTSTGICPGFVTTRAVAVVITAARASSGSPPSKPTPRTYARTMAVTMTTDSDARATMFGSPSRPRKRATSAPVTVTIHSL